MGNQRVMVFAGQKGGVGKSTIATNIATIAACAGAEVMVIDGDKQLTTKKFFDDRRGYSEHLPTPYCTVSEGSGTGRLIDNFAEKYDLVVVDLGGGDTDTLRGALMAESISQVWLPTQPSVPDIRTLPFMVELIDQYSTNRRPLTSHAIINRAETNPRVSTLSGSREYIDAIEKLSIANTIIHDRIAYKYAMVGGLSVAEFQAMKWFEEKESYRRKAPKGAQETIALFIEMMGRDPFIDIERFAAYLDEIMKGGINRG
jgi:chromosome partitioning protein